MDSFPSSHTTSPPPPKKLKMSTTTSDDDDAPNPSSDAHKPKRFKRRKIAIFLAYCGFGYQGMQKNPGAKTIESDLEDALFLSGAVPEPDRHSPKRFDWARAARTDKGVSAVAQVVSGRFYIDPPGLVDRLNSNLSPQIRIFGYKRVTGSFNAKKFCDRRRYVYLLPVFALDPNSHPDRESVLASVGSDNELLKCFECSERGRKVIGLVGRRGANEHSGTTAESGGNTVFSEAERAEETEIMEPGLVRCSNGEFKENEKTEEPRTEINEEIEQMEESKTETAGKNEKCEETGTVMAKTGERTEPGLGGFNNGEPKTEITENNEESEETGTKMVENAKKREPGLVGFSNGEQMAAPAVKGSDFYYGEKERERFNGILKHYVGTHNFHNFTTRTKAEDPSARRYIISFSADTVVTVEGMDFVRCEVVGQSFMLHQIRKLIGLAVAVMRNCTPESLIETALRKDVNVNVPTAPEVGLYLDECMFSSYNQKWKDSHEELSMKEYMEEAEEFRMKYIYSHIASMEQKEGVVGLWLHSLNHRNYPDLHSVEVNGACADVECVQDVTMGK
ncbi:uncharacterized protein LOC131243230 isoform X1 [Magnolia sinica]|uniref:uncharacterized protein LOC131243230 isoform X1 n=1 Tax=Magnolia sinica TaxID=86752 RepID=UPI0026582937|nr:uncharacterized protein LOC131243230 isoform X1 [Magnolia sinica]